MDEKLIVEKLQIILKTAWGLIFELDNSYPSPRLIWNADKEENNSKLLDLNDEVVNLDEFRKVNSEANCIFEFTAEEISKMPKEFRNFFRYGGKNHRIRKKENGVYEIRFMKNGINISASSKVLTEAKRRFIEKCHEVASSAHEAKARKKPTLLSDFAKRWIDTVKKPNVVEDTLKDYERQLRIHILPAFGALPIASIKPMALREFLNVYLEKQQFRTAEKLHVILKSLFEDALEEDLIEKNPMRGIPNVDYEAENGTALTKEEEKYFIEELFRRKHPLRYALIFLLYTGMRRSELKDAKTDGIWIETLASKTRKHKVKIKRIPISPMLKPYMEFFTPDNLAFKGDRLSRAVSAILPAHHLHDLRHTFITRTQECGVPEAVVKLWVGHAADKRNMTASVYTHFSDEFQLQEIAKVFY